MQVITSGPPCSFRPEKRLESSIPNPPHGPASYVCIYLEDPGAEYSAAAPGGVIFRVEEKRNAVDCVIPPTAM